MHAEDLPRSLAEFKAGSKIAARIAIIAITTRSSIRVKHPCFTLPWQSKASLLYSAMAKLFHNTFFLFLIFPHLVVPVFIIQHKRRNRMDKKLNLNDKKIKASQFHHLQESMHLLFLQLRQLLPDRRAKIALPGAKRSPCRNFSFFPAR